MFHHRTISVFIITYLAKKGRNHIGWYLFDIKKESQISPTLSSMHPQMHTSILLLLYYRFLINAIVK